MQHRIEERKKKRGAANALGVSAEQLATLQGGGGGGGGGTKVLPTPPLDVPGMSKELEHHKPGRELNFDFD